MSRGRDPTVMEAPQEDMNITSLNEPTLVFPPTKEKIKGGADGP